MASRVDFVTGHPRPHVAGLVGDDGATVDVNGGGCGPDIVAIHIGSEQACMFDCGGMTFATTMNHLESLATRYVEEVARLERRIAELEGE